MWFFKTKENELARQEVKQEIDTTKNAILATLRFMEDAFLLKELEPQQRELLRSAIKIDWEVFFMLDQKKFVDNLLAVNRSNGKQQEQAMAIGYLSSIRERFGGELAQYTAKILEKKNEPAAQALAKEIKDKFTKDFGKEYGSITHNPEEIEEKESLGMLFFSLRIISLGASQELYRELMETMNDLELYSPRLFLVVVSAALEPEERKHTLEYLIHLVNMVLEEAIRELLSGSEEELGLEKAARK